ncbi:prolyl 4-hydroxylase 1 [Panicum miliaceum]|uniref:Prolyl 4-hydroxylase 1 n=1 Tax=Panicum miliaceum TaxID=4540 RepID=A0A3L6RA65_PANMI|nr:prolyl 4-hydroxylase 1 [Panicum miliaceum]
MPGGGELWTEELSSEPRASLYHNFLSKEECDYLISLAKPHLKKSRVVDAETGGTKESSGRTSSGMFLKRWQDWVVRRIEKRIADYTSIPVEKGEGLRVLHYEVGQKFDPHFDYYEIGYETKNRGPRQATLLMSEVEDGGETVFPSAVTAKSGSSRGGCARRGALSVQPKMGDALLFWSMRPDGSLDPRSLHDIILCLPLERKSLYHEELASLSRNRITGSHENIVAELGI